MSETVSDHTGNSSQTRYYVLRTVQDVVDVTAINGDQWAIVGHVETQSAEAAIRKVCQESPHFTEGTFVAVPSRSWKPVTVRAEQTTVLRIEEAT